MDALTQIVQVIDRHIGNLIDVANMPAEDKADLKGHLLAAQDILLRNGNVKLQEVIGAITEKVLSRF